MLLDIHRGIIIKNTGNNMNNLSVVIMAGGKGTRFWPKSTEEKPKQFLSLIDERTMLQITFDRAKKIVREDKIFIATNEKYIELVKAQLPTIKAQNIISEPYSKNTAPSIALACRYINQIYEDQNLAFIPSDHLIKDETDFKNKILDGAKFVNKNHSSIVTIGITPSRPETGYGYIKLNSKIKRGVNKVEKFVEKPNLETAISYFNSQEYLWNAGMFIFNLNNMIDVFEKNLPKTFKVINNLACMSDVKYYEELKNRYNDCEEISFDYAVLEKSDNIYVIPADFGWDDIGTWKSLERYNNTDENHNILRGEVLTLNAKNCVVYGNKKRIILVDVDDLYIIDGEKEIVVCKKTSTDK